MGDKESKWIAPRQATVDGEFATPQTQFNAPTTKRKAKLVARPKRVRATRERTLERYGAEIKEKGKTTIDEWDVGTDEGDIKWYELSNNIWENDLRYMEQVGVSNLTDSDLGRIFNDILTHREIALEKASKISEDDRLQCIGEFDGIMDDFHRQLKIAGRDFYTKWEAEQILHAMRNTGIEYPAEIVGSVAEKGYSTKDIDIKVDCGTIPEGLRGEERYHYMKNALEMCAIDVKKTIGCRLRTVKVGDDIFVPAQGLPHNVPMTCEVIPTGREVPVDFFLELREEG